MFSRFQLVKKYLHYYFTSSNAKGHGIHSPFAFDFVKNVLNDKKKYDVYKDVESLRNNLLLNHNVVEVEDMGAGSAISKHKQRKVAAITRFAAKPKKFAQLLYRIARYYQPGNIFELGTSVGITTSYLALANKEAKVTTFEGARTVAGIAESNFKKLGLENVQIVLENFDDTLSNALLSLNTLDFAFIDGNHRKEPTLRYFKILLAKINSSSILIFDDIHWSAEMEEAWEEIKADPAVSLSIDLFFIGLVFFRKDFKVKQHFVINF